MGTCSRTTNVFIRHLVNVVIVVKCCSNWKGEVMSTRSWRIVQDPSRWKEMMKKARWFRGDLIVTEESQQTGFRWATLWILDTLRSTERRPSVLDHLRKASRRESRPCWWLADDSYNNKTNRSGEVAGGLRVDLLPWWLWTDLDFGAFSLRSQLNNVANKFLILDELVVGFKQLDLGAVQHLYRIEVIRIGSD